jgi:AraC-like DNA-binding protein
MFLGFAQGLFLVFFLLNKKRHEGISIVYLVLLLFVASLLFLTAALHQTRQTKLLIIFGPFFFPLVLSVGPLLYLYIKATVEEDYKPKIIDIFYFFPTLFAFFFLVRIYFFPSDEQVRFIESFYSHDVSLPETLFRYFDIAYRATFVILSIKLLTDYREKLKEEFSGLEKIDYGWLKQLLIIYLVSIFVLLLVTVMNLDNDYRIVIATYLAIIMYVIGYKITTDTERRPAAQGKSDERAKAKYEKTSLSQDDKILLKNRLVDKVEKNRLYTDPELTLQKLADEIGATRNQVSQIINEQFGKNFYEFINGYRIELAKRLLVSEEYKTESILSIAFEVGFQSKSTFNAVFKKLTNQTPSQFRKKKQ